MLELDASEIVLRRQSLGLVRRRVISGGFADTIAVTNYTTRVERVALALMLDADFADIFELRGVVRPQRGERLRNKAGKKQVSFGYRGLDGVERWTHIGLSEAMAVVDDGPDAAAGRGPVRLDMELVLDPGQRRELRVEVWSEVNGSPERPTRRTAPRIDADAAHALLRDWQADASTIDTGHPLTQRALLRAGADLRLLLNDGPAPGEHYIAAGVPWFSCLFGRDSIITALQLLMVRPEIARSTLRILARLQATEVDDFRDAQPGKILHELRSGELARTGEIPHTPYYGSVDATPLWLMLLDEYERWTADGELVEELWPHALAALAWIDDYGDVDGDGFVEYERRSRRGLVNQGWKDSADAIRFADGTVAAGAIALVEVQAYVYAARRGVARLARLRGDDQLAARESEQADRLRDAFERMFWMADAKTYALALDGEKRRVDAVSSNAGHALWAGIASPERAESVAAVLTGAAMWSGWGIRTLSAEMTGYNPIGYHLGTIWPHDNAICAAGFARYGLAAAARLVAETILEATDHFDEARLPELYCGFSRQRSPEPVAYPVACSPQAWAAGSLFQMIAAMLGMRPAARERRLDLVQPSLPAWMPSLSIHKMQVGDTDIDLAFLGGSGTTSVEVLRRTRDLDVSVHV